MTSWSQSSVSTSNLSPFLSKEDLPVGSQHIFIAVDPISRMLAISNSLDRDIESPILSLEDDHLPTSKVTPTSSMGSPHLCINDPCSLVPEQMLIKQPQRYGCHVCPPT